MSGAEEERTRINAINAFCKREREALNIERPQRECLFTKEKRGEREAVSVPYLHTQHLRTEKMWRERKKRN